MHLKTSSIQKCNGSPSNRTHIGPTLTLSRSESKRGVHLLSRKRARSRCQTIDRTQLVCSKQLKWKANHPLTMVWTFGISFRFSPQNSETRCYNFSTLQCLPRTRPTNTFSAMSMAFNNLMSSAKFRGTTQTRSFRPLFFLETIYYFTYCSYY